MVREIVWLWPRWAVRAEMSVHSLWELRFSLRSQKRLPCVQAYKERKLRLRYAPAYQNPRGSHGISGLKGSATCLFPQGPYLDHGLIV